MRYCSVHHHSTFSYQDGFGLPSSHIDRCAELGITAMVLSEHGNVSSHVQLEQASKAVGVKSLFGCELYTGFTDERRTQRKNHLTVLASDQEGYRNLLRIVSQGWRDFHYYPTVNSATLLAHKQGLIVLSGCTSSLFACSLVGGKNIEPEDASYERAKGVAAWFKKHFGDAYYLEVQTFPELDKVKLINQAAEQIGRELGIKLVATGDVHYTKPNESEMQQILHSARGGARDTIEDLDEKWGYDVKLCPPLTDLAVVQKLQATGLTLKAATAAMLVTEEVAQRCNVTLPKSSPIVFPLPEGYATAEALWRQQLKDGWKFRDIPGKPNLQAYVDRIRYEIEIITSKQYWNYFLLVGDVVRFAKDRGIPVGPGRGSAAGSLVCYLLRITEVDPLRFPNLIFERFIDITRADLPDIDLDFDDDRRGEIREYMVKKYGVDRVSNIGTFTRYKAKNSLDDIARVYRIKQWEVDIVKELLLERSSGDLRASATIEDTVDQFQEAKDVFDRHPELWKATRLEGNYKGMGVHAAGIVVSDAPITDTCAIYRREVGSGKGKKEVREVMSPDKYDAEYLGLLKIDLLGLSTMGMLRTALRLTGMTLEELYHIPLDDEDTIDGFRRNDVVGVFQFDGRAVRAVNAEVKPDNFNEVTDVTALARPGPLHNSSSVHYTDNKNGLKPIDTIHPLFDAIVGPTHGQVIYQEQVLRIVTEIGNFDWTHAAYIRKIISRKIGDQEFNRQWGRFKDGANSHGISDELAKKIWGLCITSGSYAFCPTGDTVVKTGGANKYHNGEYRLDDLWEAYNSNTALGTKLRCGQNGKRISIQAMDEDGRIRPAPFLSIDRYDIKVPVFKVTLQNGMSFKASESHLVMTTSGYKRLKNCKKEDGIVVQDLNYQYKQGERYRANPIKSTYRGKGFQTGMENPAWVDGRTEDLAQAQTETLDRSGGLCEHCGESGGRTEFAHVLPLETHKGDYKKYHHPDNLMYLCNPCHKTYDYKMGMRQKRDSKGRPTTASKIRSINPAGQDWVYEIHMADRNHNFVGNGVVHHNNAAHSVSYALISYWAMYLKQNHPTAFYAAALEKYDQKTKDLMRDADRHGIEVKAPSLKRSSVSWARTTFHGAEVVQAGFSQIPGVGPKVGEKIVTAREAADLAESPFARWRDLEQIKGIGPKTVRKMYDFSTSPDPWDIYKLTNEVNTVKRLIRRGELPGVALPTHTCSQIPSVRTASDIPVVWAGRITYKNLRDLFEVNFSRTGEALDPDKIKDVHLREWVILRGVDDEDDISMVVDRWKYPYFKRAIWGIDPDDLVIVKGIRPKRMSWRYLKVNEMWVINVNG